MIKGSIVISSTTGRRLKAGSALSTAALLFFGATAPAMAQSADTPQAAAPAPAPAEPDNGKSNDIVVTGTLFKSSATSIASPVTVITSADLAARGVTTVQGAIQSLASNNGPALTNSFTANGAFAGGASGVSLRGLTTNSTLTLFDGLHAAYYPLADDGVRNFVDLNTIPDEIVDRVDVLRDGASALYGADAVAGVVNIITKKQIKGFSATGEAGISQRGDAANQRFSVTAGFGDLSEQRYNVYFSAHYLHQDPLYSSQRGYPYNTDNQSGICYNGTCGTDNRQNSPTNFSGVSTIAPVFLVRPYDSTNTTPVAGSRYQFLNPAAGCGNLTPYTLTDAEYAAFPTAPRTVCTSDSVAQAGVIEPSMTRVGAAARASVEIGDSAHAYLMGNFEQSKSSYTGYGLAGAGIPTNSVIRGNAPAGIDFPRFSTSTAANPSLAPGSFVLDLPVYICPVSTPGACNATNGTLNPNNPFASLNQVARIIGEIPNMKQFTSALSRTYRLAGGVNGTFAGSWQYNLDATGMITRLQNHYEGYVYIQHLLDEIKDGSYNFVNPYANSAAVTNYLAPAMTHRDSSKEYEVRGTISHKFFDLPGGPLQVAVGGSWRYEGINSPSANPDYNGPTERYFVLNAFGTVGHREVESGFFQVTAPVFNFVTLDASGRYDHYSTGQEHFSPKGGIVFKPVRQVTLRGTVSGGFRIPNFAESSALPTTGYVPIVLSTLPAAYLAQYSNPGVTCTAATPGNCSTYLTQASTGEESTSNPNLKPEISRSIDVGVDFRPVRALTISVDYYNIRKKHAITPAAYSAAIDAYYAGEAIPAGYTIVANAPDINHPTALPTIATVGAPFVNANTITTDGLDFSAQLRLNFKNGWSLTTLGEAEYIHKLNTTFPDGHVEKYAGTLGNFNLTAGSGTPRWKATLQNTLDFNKKGSISVTAYYTSGYNLSAEDQEGPDTAGDCGLSSGIQACDVKSFLTFDATASINVGQHLTVYANLLNMFDRKPPLDTVTYGGYLYNPVVAEAGIIGRAFRFGAKMNF